MTGLQAGLSPMDAECSPRKILAETYPHPEQIPWEHFRPARSTHPQAALRLRSSALLSACS